MAGRSAVILDFQECLSGRVPSAAADAFYHVVVHAFYGEEGVAVVAFGVGEGNRFRGPFAGGWRGVGRVLGSGGCAFFGGLQEWIYHVLLLLPAAWSFHLESLSVDVVVWFVDIGTLFAVFDPRFWFSGSVAVGWVEEAGEVTFWADYFGGGFHGIAF